MIRAALIRALLFIAPVVAPLVSVASIAACDYGSSGAPPPAPPAPTPVAPSPTPPAPTPPTAPTPSGERSLRPAVFQFPRPPVAKLLGGLLPGDVLAGWEVTGMTGDPAHQIALTLRRDPASITIWIEPRQSPPLHPAPRETQSYAITYQGDPGGQIPQDVDPLLDELAARLKAHEGSAG